MRTQIFQYILILSSLSLSLSVNAEPWVIQTVAGSGATGMSNGGDSGDGGLATLAQLNRPHGLAVDAQGNVYIADSWNHRIRKVDNQGRISTLAGVGTPGYNGDGILASTAQLAWPQALMIDSDGSLYIADTGNNRVRRVSPEGLISTLAGNGQCGYSGDGGPATQAKLNGPISLVRNANGGLFYIVDGNNHVIRSLDAQGIIRTYAGGGPFSETSIGDGGPATDAQLWSPIQAALDGAGYLYVADMSNNRIRRISPDGVIETVVGAGYRGNFASGYSGDGKLAWEAEISLPEGLAFDALGNLYIGDWGNDVIRQVDLQGRINTFAGNGRYGYSGDGGSPRAAQLGGVFNLAVGQDGAVYFTDSNSHRIRRIGSNRPPVAVIQAATQRGSAPLQVRLDGSASYDLEGPISAYHWHSEFANPGTGASYTLTLPQAGTYQVTLTVQDSLGASTAQSLTLQADNNQAPVADFSLTPSSGFAPLSVQAEASTAYDPDGQISAYQWLADYAEVGTGVAVNLHFDEAGMHQITLRVTDNQGAQSQLSRHVEVQTTLTCAGEGRYAYSSGLLHLPLVNIAGQADSWLAVTFRLESNGLFALEAIHAVDAPADGETACVARYHHDGRLEVPALSVPVPNRRTEPDLELAARFQAQADFRFVLTGLWLR